MMKLDVDLRLSVGDRARAFEVRARFESNQDRIVLFGPSGVGKTLTLQAIAGLIAPLQGHVRVGGRTLFDDARGIDLPARERRIGYVFQDYALFPHLSVTRNVAFGLTPALPWRIPPAVARQVDDTLESLGLGGLQARRPSTLSGGQRQRVALARALIRQPELLLLDEPFAALDIGLRDRVRDELDDIRARFQVPMVLISHDLEDVRRFADTLVLFDAGRVVRVAHGLAEAVPLAEASLRGHVDTRGT